ncbi:MAG TPA: class II fructose-bisphosphate aldolase [Chthonomonadaceae bacterium]|nr:class II fructose-bisphosphate aldolase [Chthonomonadaceae bacterium]
MPLASTLEILRRARREGYAVAGFEPYNIEQIQAVIETAEEERAPVLIQLWAEVIQTWGVEALVGIVREAAGRAQAPVGLHLDHATDDALIDVALAAGFTSVMFDGSTLPLEENIARTRAVVARAHARGVPVEAELGLIGHLQPQDDVEAVMEQVTRLLTDVPTAVRFVRETGLDVLAPAVGTIHGCRLPVARVDIARIAALAEATGVPLALHGGSGVGDRVIQEAIRAGIAKVNIDTEVRTVTIAALKEAVAHIGTTGAPIFMDFAAYPRAVKAATKEAVRHRLRMVGASGKA